MANWWNRAIAQGVLSVTMAVAVVSCGSGTTPPPHDTVVLDDMWSLKDGEGKSLKLEPGLYRLEMTASGDGASVEWVGGDCPRSAEVKTYSSVCELRQTGQVLVTNPTGFGLGAGTTVTMKVSKLGR